MQLGPYRVLSELGRGGMGVVYRAHDPALDREVALKVLTTVGTETAELALRFRREAQAMARLRHPNIVGVHSVGTTPQGLPYLVMDLVEGESLAARVARDGPLPEAEAVRSFEALARALEHAHLRGVLHRDLKPHNVLVDRDGLVLTDFGLAALVTAETRLTRSGDTMGTPAYMAPEQAKGERGRLGPATDVHGLGATLFHALTGEPPYRGASALEVLEAVTRDDAPDPRALRPGLDPALAAVVLTALAKEPSARYPTAEAFAAALGALRPTPGRARPERDLARGVRVAVLAALGVLVLTAGVGLGRATAPAAPPPSPTPPSPTPPSPTPRVGAQPPEGALAPEDRAARAIDRDARVRAAHDRAWADDGPAARAIYDELLASAPDDVAALLARAVLAREGTARTPPDLEAARVDLERALALAPGCGAVLAQQALLAIDRQDAPAALALAEAATDAAPRSATAWQVRAVIECGRDLARARAFALRAVELDPRDPDPLLALAAIDAARGDLQAAIAGLRRAIDLAPWNERARIDLARHLLSAGETAAAADACAALRALRPRERAGFVLGAQVAVELGRTAEGLRLARAAVALAPSDEAALQGLATACLVDRRPAEAVSALDELLRLRAVPGARSLRALALLMAGRRSEAHAEARALLANGENAVAEAVDADRLAAQDPARALALYDRALEAFPGVPWVRLARARLRHAQGDAAGAAADLDTILRDGPSAEALLQRARWARERGDLGGALDDALAAARALRDEDPLAPELRALVLDLGAWPRATTPAELERIALAAERTGAGVPDEALAALAPVLREDPANPLARLVRARALLAADDLGAAQAELEGLARVASGSAWTRASRAEVLARRHDDAAALVEARAATQLDPTLGSAHRILSETLLALGRSEEAFRVIEDAAARGLPGSRVLQARAHLALDRPAEVLRATEDAARRGSGTELLSYRVLALAELGRLDEAEALMASAWRRVPVIADLLGARAAVRERRRDLAGVVADLRLALLATPGRGDLGLQLLRAHLMTHDVEAARALVDEMARSLGEESFIVFARAQVMAASGDAAGARRECELLRSNFPPGHIARRQAEELLRDLDRAGAPR